LNGEIRLLPRHLRRLARDDEDDRLLMSILGVGYYLALLIKAEIGDVNRFICGGHLRSCAGIVPSIHSSGEGWLGMEGLLVPVVNFMKATEGKNRVLRLEDTSKSSKGHLSVCCGANNSRRFLREICLVLRS